MYMYVLLTLKGDSMLQTLRLDTKINILLPQFNCQNVQQGCSNISRE